MIYKLTEADGRVAIMPVYACPFEATPRQAEFQSVVALLRGKPPRDGRVIFASATVTRMPQEVADAEPAKAVLELLNEWQESEEAAITPAADSATTRD